MKKTILFVLSFTVVVYFTHLSVMILEPKIGGDGIFGILCLMVAYACVVEVMRNLLKEWEK